MEGIPLMPKRPEIKSIEKEANFEGNHTLLMLERMADPIIREQIIDILVQADVNHSKVARRVVFNEDGSIPRDVKGEMITESIIPLSREEISDRLDAWIEAVKNKTEISFEDKMPDSLTMHLNWCAPWLEEKLSVKQKGMVEAHEKGHCIRKYDDLPELLLSGFDWNRMSFNELYYQYAKKEKPDLSFDQWKTDLVTYMKSPSEIVERMSQLKNYFGLTGGQVFTKEHLDYARQHYILDTGLDNNMTEFFYMITSETETEFLRLINSSGV